MKCCTAPIIYLFFPLWDGFYLCLNGLILFSPSCLSLLMKPSSWWRQWLCLFWTSSEKHIDGCFQVLLKESKSISDWDCLYYYVILKLDVTQTSMSAHWDKRDQPQLLFSNVVSVCFTCDFSCHNLFSKCFPMFWQTGQITNVEPSAGGRLLWVSFEMRPRTVSATEETQTATLLTYTVGRRPSCVGGWMDSWGRKAGRWGDSSVTGVHWCLF